MSWARIDDQFFTHPKVIDLSKDGKLLYLAALTYCTGHLTDGEVTPGALRVIAATVDVNRAVADELVGAGLWDATENGWKVHDYHDYQPTREKSLATKEARSQAGSRGGQKSADNKAQATIQANIQANAEQNAEQMPEQNGKPISTPSHPILLATPEDTPPVTLRVTAPSGGGAPPEVGKPKRARASPFVPPTLEQTREYFALKGWTGLEEEFLDFQAARGWRYKAGPVSDWQAAARTWKRQRDEYRERDGRNGNRNGRNGHDGPKPLISKHQPNAHLYPT